MIRNDAHQSAARVGVLLVNLGTPSAPTASAIRAYLRPFLSDPRVVELPRWLWLPILHGFILPFRPGRLVEAYGKVWTEDGSPLLCISQRQQKALQLAFGDELVLELAMTYGEPSIESALDRLQKAHVRKLLILPLYPQYSATTTAAVLDKLFGVLGKQRWLPELRTIHQYHDEPAYIEALAVRLHRHWAQHGRGDHLLMSFHSIPRKCLERGDPYYCHCQKTARLLAEKLQLSDQQWSISFQSRIGRQPWLQPYTDVVMPQLASRGFKSLDVICPGFAADCLETLEEVAIRYSDLFVQAGGEQLNYVEALNDSSAHIDCLASMIRRNTQGWQKESISAETITERMQRVEQSRGALHHPSLI